MTAISLAAPALLFSFSHVSAEEDEHERPRNTWTPPETSAEAPEDVTDTEATDESALTEDTSAAEEAVADSPAARPVDSIIGSRVESPDGERLGRIDDLVIDLESGQLIYALVSTGRIFGVNFRPIPPEALTIRELRRGIALTLEVPETGWDDAPSISRREDVSRLGAEEYAQEIYSVYGYDWGMRQETALELENATSPENGEADTAAAPGETPENEETDALARPGRLHLATDLTGNSVASRELESIGRLDNFLVDFEKAQLFFALIEPSLEYWEQTDDVYAVAPHALVIEGDQIFLNVSPGDLEEARILTPANIRVQAEEQMAISSSDAKESPEVFLYEARDGRNIFGARPARNDE